MKNEITGREIAEMWQKYGNTEWTASIEFLITMSAAAQALDEGQCIVECGSGLTTLVLRRVVPERRIVSLEHDAVEAMKNGARHAPLRSYGEYDWYDEDALADVSNVGLVVCDGPPGNTRGGRYGCWPHLKDRLGEAWIFILDDVHREREMELVTVAWKWPEETLMFLCDADDRGRQFACMFSPV